MSELYIFAIALGIGIYFYHKDNQRKEQKLNDLENQLKILREGQNDTLKKSDEDNQKLSSRKKPKTQPNKINDEEKREPRKGYKKLDQNEKEDRKKDRFLNNERNKKLFELWNAKADWTYEKIAAEFGLTRERVRQILKKGRSYGLSIRDKTNHAEVSKRKTISEVREEVDSALTDLYGTTKYHPWKRRFVEKHNHYAKEYLESQLKERIKSGELDPLFKLELRTFLSEEHEDVLQYKREGLTLTEIAKILNLSKVRISQLVKDLKIAGKIDDANEAQVESVSLSPEEINSRLDRIRNHMRRGLSLLETAEELNTNRDSLAHFIRNHFLKPKLASELIGKEDTSKEGSLPQLKRSGRLREFESFNHDEITMVIKGWLFTDDQHHRYMDNYILAMDSRKTKGFQSMGILHYFGLKKEFKGLFKDIEMTDAIKIMEEDPQDFREILEYLPDWTHNNFIFPKDKSEFDDDDTIVASKNQKKAEKTSESDTDNDQNKTILMKFLMGELEIFKVEKINPAYKGGMVNYQGYTIDLDEARKHNLSKDRPAHYKLPYTQEEIDAVQAAHKSGNTMVELQSYFQRRESILEKILNDQIQPSPQFRKNEASESLTSQQIEESEKSSIRDNLESLSLIIRRDNPNVAVENQFLSDENINLLLEKRPNTKKQLLIVLGPKRSIINQDEFAQNYQDILDVLSEAPPEYLDELEFDFDDLFISQDEGRMKLIEIRNRYRAMFPEIPRDQELLRDADIDFHLSHETQGDEVELTAEAYFRKRLSDARRGQIGKSIQDAGYDFTHAYAEPINEIFDVLLTVDHMRTN